MALAYIAFVAFKLLIYFYGVISMVGLWRSATKYAGPASWKFLAKATVVFGVIGYFKDYWSLLRALVSQEAFLALLEPLQFFNQL